MNKNRLEAFSDGVIAIALTIMVLELRTPHGEDFSALFPVLPKLLSYVLSFVYVGIYWNNHHHLLHLATRVTGSVLWANLNLLFWLTLLPFATAWMGENHFAPTPSAVYGFILAMAAISYYILERAMLRVEGPNSRLGKALGKDWKGKLSMVAYVVGIVAAFFVQWLAQAIYVAVALAWLIPDRRIEKVADKKEA